MENGRPKLQIYLPEETIDELEVIAKQIGLKKTDVVKVAVAQFINEYKSKNNSNQN